MCLAQGPQRSEASEARTRSPLVHYAVDEVKRQVDDMLEHGIIKHSNSPWTAGVVLGRKKDNTLRFCVDYRDL